MARRNNRSRKQGLLSRILPELSAKGRGGDTRMGHLTEGETVVPKSVAARIPGGRKALLSAFQNQGMDPGRYVVGGADDSINPATGAREYYASAGMDNPGDEAGGYNDSGGFGAGDFGDSSSDYGRSPDTENRDGGGWSPNGGGGNAGNIADRRDIFGKKDKPPPMLKTQPVLAPIPAAPLFPADPLAPTTTPPTTPPTTTATTTAPAASPAFQPKDASVSTQLENFLASDSPLMTRARTGAKQAANSRGLLNSSMAVQAGEAAALDAALPVASQQAAQIAQENLQRRQIASSEGLGYADIASREAVSQAGITMQQRIAASQLASFDKEKATAAVAQIDATYQSAFASIMANQDMPAEARDAALVHLAAIRDTNFNLVEQLYNIDLVWTSAVAQPPADAPTIPGAPTPNPNPPWSGSFPA